MEYAKALLGKRVDKLEINSCNSHLLFTLEGGEQVCWFACGDCCSVSWFNDLENVEALVGQAVLEVTNLEMPDPRSTEEIEKEKDTGEYLQFYGVRLTTAKGDVIVAFRNESNGYYGGSIELSTPSRTGVKAETWKVLTKDWSA